VSGIIIPDEFRSKNGRVDVGKLKHAVDIADVARRFTELRRSGSALKGLCPCHDERTPSFMVYVERQTWHCFGCGRGGDVIQLLHDVGERDFRRACTILADLAGSYVSGTGKHDATVAASAVDRCGVARKIWHSAQPVGGTSATKYLEARGIHGLVPSSLRFDRVPMRWDETTGQPGPLRGALIAAAQDVGGRVVGIQRIFVEPRWSGYPFKPLRLSLGRIKGAALRLGPATETVMLTGSVEDGLALQRMFVGITVWCSLGEDNLQNVRFPPGVRRVVLAGDGDTAGHAAVARAKDALEGRSLEVDVLLPRAGKDFNEEWLLLHA
jgi:DNA primase